MLAVVFIGFSLTPRRPRLGDSFIAKYHGKLESVDPAGNSGGFHIQTPGYPENYRFETYLFNFRDDREQAEFNEDILNITRTVDDYVDFLPRRGGGDSSGYSLTILRKRPAGWFEAQYQALMDQLGMSRSSSSR